MPNFFFNRQVFRFNLYHQTWLKVCQRFRMRISGDIYLSPCNTNNLWHHFERRRLFLKTSFITLKLEYYWNLFTWMKCFILLLRNYSFWQCFGSIIWDENLDISCIISMEPFIIRLVKSASRSCNKDYSYLLP